MAIPVHPSAKSARLETVSSVDRRTHRCYVASVEPRCAMLVAALVASGCGRVAGTTDAGRDVMISDAGRDAITSGVHDAHGAEDARRDATSPPCTIGGKTVANGAPNPANECQGCVSATSTNTYSDLPDGTACGLSQRCQAGSCAGCPSSCKSDEDCQIQGCALDSGLIECCNLSLATPLCIALLDGPLCPDKVPPTCSSPCTSSSDCQALCGPAPEGTIICCDDRASLCAPLVQTSCPGSLFCNIPCSTNDDCQPGVGCLAPPVGSSNCCYQPSGVCYVAPTPTCQD